MMKQIFSGKSGAFSVKRKVALWSMLLVLFLILVFLTSISYLLPSREGVLGVLTRYHFEAMLFVALGGVGIGAAGIYIFSSELKHKTTSLKGNTELMFSFLAPKEKEIILYLVERKGHTFQSDISKLPGMTRLKAHRILIKLHERKIININHYGKANIITLAAPILEAFNLNPPPKPENKSQA